VGYLRVESAIYYNKLIVVFVFLLSVVRRLLFFRGAHAVPSVSSSFLDILSLLNKNLKFTYAQLIFCIITWFLKYNFREFLKDVSVIFINSL
jgi:hypothetical protein